MMIIPDLILQKHTNIKKQTMKKILSILLFYSFFANSQTLKLRQIEYAPGVGYCITTNSLGVQTYTPCSTISGLLPSTTSITINGVTKTFTSTPVFTVQPTLSDVLGYGSSTGGIPLESPNAMNSIYAFDTNAGYGYSVLESGGCDTDDSRTRLSHSLQNVLSAPTNVFDAPANNFPNATANTVSYFDASKDLKSVVLGSGLSLSSGTLTATGSGSTTTVTAGDNITVSGSAPSYTVGVSTSPTFTNPTFTGTVTAPTPTVGSNDNSVATTSFVTQALAARSSTLITKAANSTTTLTTGTDIDDLTYSLEANSEYIIEGYIRIGNSSTGGTKFATTVPSGASLYARVWGTTSPSTTPSLIQYMVVSGTLHASVFNTVGSGTTLIEYYAHIITGATPGAMTVQSASGVSGQTTTVYALGTSLMMTKK